MDPVDSLIADESVAEHPARARRLVLLDAPDLVEAAHRVADEVVVWSDLLLPEQTSWPQPAQRPDSPSEALSGADLVWLRLPKSLAALDEYARLTAEHGGPRVRLVAGGRVKHMTRSMNEVLAVHFDEVHASLGRQKSRVLHASGPRPGGEPWPRHQHHADIDLDLWAHGATFAGTRLDPGTRLLLDHLAELAEPLPDKGLRVLDLGCGNGTLATSLARLRPGWQVLASDLSWAAVQATGLTARANHVDVEVVRADGLHTWPEADLDLVVTNPPFHVGTAKDSAATVGFFEQAGRVLRPDGQLWCVFNSHLPWRARLRELLGPTEVVAQNPKFTLTRTFAQPRLA